MIDDATVAAIDVADGAGRRTGVGRGGLRAAARPRRRRAGRDDARRSSARSAAILDAAPRGPARGSRTCRAAPSSPRALDVAAQIGPAGLRRLHRRDRRRAAARRRALPARAPSAGWSGCPTRWPSTATAWPACRSSRRPTGRAADAPRGRPQPAALREARWLLEELRMSHFAQGLGVRGQVSAKRIRKLLDAAGG